MQLNVKNSQNEAITSLLKESFTQDNVWGEADGLKTNTIRMKKIYSKHKPLPSKQTHLQKQTKQAEILKTKSLIGKFQTPNMQRKVPSLKTYRYSKTNQNRSMNQPDQLAELAIRNFSEQISHQTASNESSNNLHRQYIRVKGLADKLLYQKKTNFFKTEKVQVWKGDRKNHPKSYSCYWVEKMKEKRRQGVRNGGKGLINKDGEIKGRRIIFND